MSPLRTLYHIDSQCQAEYFGSYQSVLQQKNSDLFCHYNLPYALSSKDRILKWLIFLWNIGDLLPNSPCTCYDFIAICQTECRSYCIIEIISFKPLFMTSCKPAHRKEPGNVEKFPPPKADFNALST